MESNENESVTGYLLYSAFGTLWKREETVADLEKYTLTELIYARYSTR
jgi:hypothetical protein